MLISTCSSHPSLLFTTPVRAVTADPLPSRISDPSTSSRHLFFFFFFCHLSPPPLNVTMSRTVLLIFSSVLLLLSCQLLHAQTATGSSPVNPTLYNPAAGYITPWSYLSTFEDESSEWINVNQFSPFGREGAAYGDEGEEFAFLVGGIANLHGSAGAVRALSDVWLLNITTDTFVPCPPLPTTLYYAQAEWAESTEQLIVYGGVTSSGSPLVAETYFSGVYIITFPSPVACAGASISTIALSPAVSGRKYHSIEIIDGVLYVFGGYNAVSPIPQSQLFFTVNLASGATSLLSTSSPYFPVGIIEPAILEDEGEHILFFYSGTSGPAGMSGSVFPPAGTLYRYDWERNQWLVPISPMLGGSSENLLEYPQFVYSCHTHTLDDEHWFFAGGQDNFNNSLETIVHFDMSTDSTVGVPTVTILYGELPGVGLEHCAIALATGGEIIVYTGYSEGVDASASAPYPTGIYEAVLPFLSTVLVQDSYSTFIAAEDATAEWAATGVPPHREGAAYGCDGTNVYFTAGAVLSAETVLTFTDVWAANAPGDKYISYSTNLPGPTYFGTSVWYNTALWVWGGRTNTQGSGTLNTYNPHLYQINFALNPPVATTITLGGSLSSSLVGTQHASSVQLNGKMYIFGGTNGMTGTSTPATTQHWFSINLASGALTQESQSGLDFPSTIWVNPVLFTSSAGRYIYLYSGMEPDYATWNNNFDVFIYDTQALTWLQDVEPLVGAFSALTPQFPNMAFGAKTVSSDGNHVIVVGGTWGDTSPNGAGSHTRLFHIDVTPMLTSPATGRPVISILSTTLPNPTESMVAGLTQNNNEIIVFSGAQYFNSELGYPISYVSSLLEIPQAGFELPSAPSTATCNSGSSLSGGQIAGIVVGSILGTAVIVGLLMYYTLLRGGKGALNYATQSDFSSSGTSTEMARA